MPSDTTRADPQDAEPPAGVTLTEVVPAPDTANKAGTADNTLGILLLSGAHERAHYAFVVASGAAAIGRRVILFATNGGCRALCGDWSGLEDVGRDERIREAGVAGLQALRDASIELDVRLIACEAGLRSESIDASELLPGVEIAGIATFLGAVGAGQIVSL